MSEIKDGYQPEFVTPLGDQLREILVEQRINIPEFAQACNLPPIVVDGILRGSVEIDCRTARKIELAIGVRAEFWLDRPEKYLEFIKRVLSE